jgi:chromosome segregation ATPase
MEELREQLEAKQQELDDLQVQISKFLLHLSHSPQSSFDEFVESSKELESELEGTLNEMEEKRRETIKQIRTLDNKVAELNLKNENLVNENNKLQTLLNKKTETLNETMERLKELELINSDFENKIRELEFTESELLAKIELIEEEKIILQYNAEGN